MSDNTKSDNQKLLLVNLQILVQLLKLGVTIAQIILLLVTYQLLQKQKAQILFEVDAMIQEEIDTLKR